MTRPGIEPQYIYVYIYRERERERNRDKVTAKERERTRERGERWYCLVCFYGISTIVCYLMPNPFSCILAVLFQMIQFSISIQFKCQKQFYFKQFSLAQVHCLVLFNPEIELLLRERVDLGAMLIKEFSAFLKTPVLLKSRVRIV